MFEQFADLVKNFGQDAVVTNPEVPNELNNEVLADATSTVAGGMKNLLAGGGLESVLSLFNNNKNENAQSGSSGIGSLLKNPMVSMMIGHFASKLISKYNMNADSANSVANKLIPSVIDGFVKKTASTAPEDSGFNLNSLINAFTGGKVATAQAGGGGGFDFQSLISQFTGGGNAGGGNLTDIISQVTRGVQENTQQQSKTDGGGGIASMIKGLFS